MENGESKEFRKALTKLNRTLQKAHKLIKEHGDPFEGMTTIEILDEIRKNK